MSNIAIKIENLSKVYKLYDRPLDRLKESLHPLRRKYHHDFFALDNVSFEIKKGETVGIIGKNGSGKSTILKIIAGVLTPTAGKVTIDGRISALLELGTGFNPEFTGLENIYFSGTIMGYTKEQMDKKVDDILAFADIGEYINQPVKSYSSGMFVRLAFAVATSVNPDILIVDEALSVGDIFFQSKCMARIKKMIDNNVTLLFVSHEPWTVKQLCERGILLNEGQMLLDSEASSVTEHYFKLQVSKTQKVETDSENLRRSLESGADNNDLFTPPASTSLRNADEITPDIYMGKESFEKHASFERIQNGRSRFLNVQMIDSKNIMKNIFNFGERVTYRMLIETAEPLINLNVSYHIRTKTGVDIVYGDTRVLGQLDYKYIQNRKYILDWEFRLNLVHGQYCINCGLALPPHQGNPDWEYIDFIPFAYDFSVIPRKEGMIDGFVVWKNDLGINLINE